MNILNLIFDPQRDPTPPPAKRKNTARRKPRTPDKSIKYDKRGRPWRHTKEDNETKTEVWELDNPGGQRDKGLKDKDRTAIQDNRLFEKKYRIIKASWATRTVDKTYRTARQTSEALSRDYGPGYGIRTVEKYYALINQANPSPREQSQAGDRK